LAFNNSEQAEIIPILGLVYSVKRSALSEEDEAIVLETPYPFAIDFFHGKIKPDLTVFLKPFFMSSVVFLPPTTTSMKQWVENLLLHCVALWLTHQCVHI
jgi:hypothetical protein